MIKQFRSDNANDFHGKKYIATHDLECAFKLYYIGFATTFAHLSLNRERLLGSWTKDLTEHDALVCTDVKVECNTRGSSSRISQLTNRVFMG